MEKDKKNNFLEKKSLDISSRRKFLKKAIYTAPTLIVLGQLVKPTSVHADRTGGPDGPPGGGWRPW